MSRTRPLLSARSRWSSHSRASPARFAGAFGSYIEPKYAMVIGLIPDCDLDRVSSVGNAAGTGARMALLSRKHRAEVEKLVTHIEKIETEIGRASCRERV